MSWAQDIQRVAELEEENEKLRKALEWYADPDKHEIKRRIGGDFAPITLDKGKIAIKALGKEQNT